MNDMNKAKKSDFFKGLYQWESKEYDVVLPIIYYDCSAISAVFTASTRLVKRHLPDGLYPVEMFPGRCLVTVSGFEYRNSDIGAYNEFSVAAVVKRKRTLPLLPVMAAMVSNSFEVFIIKLPVTSERARRGRVELGGYPKFLADIEFKKSGNMTECRLSHGKNGIVVMKGKNLKTSGFRKIRYGLYTSLGGCLIKSNLFLNPKQFAQSFRGSSASIEIGKNHEICDFLSGIRLGKKPVVYQYIPSYEALLCGNKNIIDD